MLYYYGLALEVILIMLPLIALLVCQSGDRLCRVELRAHTLISYSLLPCLKVRLPEYNLQRWCMTL